MELNNLESFIYKYRRDTVVNQNPIVLKKLNSLLEWVEGDGQFANLDETRQNYDGIKERVSRFKRTITFLRYVATFSQKTKVSSLKKRGCPPEAPLTGYNARMLLYTQTHCCQSSTGARELSRCIRSSTHRLACDSPSTHYVKEKMLYQSQLKFRSAAVSILQRKTHYTFSGLALNGCEYLLSVQD